MVQIRRLPFRSSRFAPRLLKPAALSNKFRASGDQLKKCAPGSVGFADRGLDIGFQAPREEMLPASLEVWAEIRCGSWAIMLEPENGSFAGARL